MQKLTQGQGVNRLGLGENGMRIEIYFEKLWFGLSAQDIFQFLKQI
jgi:hypothetical protein